MILCHCNCILLCMGWSFSSFLSRLDLFFILFGLVQVSPSLEIFFRPQYSMVDILVARRAKWHILCYPCGFPRLFLLPSFKQAFCPLLRCSFRSGIQKENEDGCSLWRAQMGDLCQRGRRPFSSGWREKCGYREIFGNWEGNLRWLKTDAYTEVVELFDEHECWDDGLKRKFGGCTELGIGCWPKINKNVKEGGIGVPGWRSR